jgi:hypothetical protein
MPFIYRIYRAIKDSDLLINNSFIGGKVKEFRLPDGYKQVLKIDGEVMLFEYIPFSISPWLVREKKIEEYIRKKYLPMFEDRLLETTDKEIELFNAEWDITPYLRLKEPVDNYVKIEHGSNKIILSMENGKRMPDHYVYYFKPLFSDYNI